MGRAITPSGYYTLLITNVTAYGSPLSRRFRGDDSEGVSPHKIPELRMLAQVIHHEAAAGNHLQSIGADQLQRALHQFRGDAAAAQRSRRLGMGDDDGAQTIIRKRHRALDALAAELRRHFGMDEGDDAVRYLVIGRGSMAVDVKFVALMRRVGCAGLLETALFI